jgi:hypothetical protein
MDKKAKKRIDVLQQKLQKLRQQLAGAKKQNDDPTELAQLERNVVETESELAKLREA